MLCCFLNFCSLRLLAEMTTFMLLVKCFLRSSVDDLDSAMTLTHTHGYELGRTFYTHGCELGRMFHMAKCELMNWAGCFTW